MAATELRDAEPAYAIHRLSDRVVFLQNVVKGLVAIIAVLVLVIGGAAWLYREQADRINDAAQAAHSTAVLSSKQECRVEASANTQLGQLHWRQAISALLLAASSEDLAGEAAARQAATASNMEEQAGNDALRAC